MFTLSRKFLSHLLLALSLPLAAWAGYKPGPGWPEVSTPFYHATTAGQAEIRLAVWRGQPGHAIGTYRDTGSMHPVLSGGRELLAMEVCRPDTPLRPGDIVQFDRGDVPAALHYIAAISSDGGHLYISGLNNRYSDGWFSRAAVAYVVREIIVAPATKSLPPSNLAVLAAPSSGPAARQP